MDQWKITPLCCCCPFSTLLGFSARKCCLSRSSRSEMFCEKGVLRNFAKLTGKQLCQSLFFDKVAGSGQVFFIKKENLAQVFSSEFCKISKDTFSYRTLLVATSNCHLYCSSKYYHSGSEAYLESWHFMHCKERFTRRYRCF